MCWAATAKPEQSTIEKKRKQIASSFFHGLIFQLFSEIEHCIPWRPPGKTVPFYQQYPFLPVQNQQALCLVYAAKIFIFITSCCMALRRLDTKTAAVNHSIYLSVVFRQLFKTKVYLGIDMGLRQSHRRYPKPQNQGLHPLISQEHSYTNQTGRHQRNEIDKKTLVKNFPKRLPPIGPLAGRLANMGFFPALMSFSLLTITRLSVLTVQHRRPYQPGIVAELR